jgi:methylated-DNA-protein-cysteine methyltransferase-like protein
MTYGDVAEYIGTRAPRAVGRVLARSGGAVPWHRVVRADGSCAERLAARQQELLRAEGVPLERGRVVLTRCRWDGSLPYS